MPDPAEARSLPDQSRSAVRMQAVQDPAGTAQEVIRLRAENEELRGLLGRAYQALGPMAHLDGTAREIKAARIRRRF